MNAWGRKSVKLILLILFTVTGNTFAAGIEKACFNVEGMTCAACSLTLKTAVMKIDGIISVSASPKDHKAVVEFHRDKTNAEAIQNQINNTGYQASVKECPKG